MRIAIIGATGNVGASLLEQARAAGSVVKALARDPARLADDSGVEWVVGEIGDLAAVARVVEGTEAVLWTVGAIRNTPEQAAIFEAGARNLVAAMDGAGVRRLIALSGAGITIEGERKPLGGRAMSGLVRVLARHVFEAKRREYEVFTASGLEWTLVRPPRVVEGPRTGRVVIGGRLAGREVTQGDLADAMLRQLDDTTHLRAAPYVSTPPAQRDTPPTPRDG